MGEQQCSDTSTLDTGVTPSNVTVPVVYPLFSNLNPSDAYTVEVFKLTEPDYNTRWFAPNYVELHAWTVSGPSPLSLPNPSLRSNRRIEFIGDSITCGYCNLCKSMPNDTPAYQVESFAASWAHLTCQAFGAECHVIAWSGFGMVRNCCGGNVTVPMLYNRTLATSESHAWSFDPKKWMPPQAVVINLGTNDMLNGSNPSGEWEQRYVAEYVRLLRQIGAVYGRGTNVFLICGPMSTEYCPYVFEVIKRASPFVKTNFLDHRGVLNTTNTCCSHPDVDADRVLAQLTINKLTRQLHW